MRCGGGCWTGRKVCRLERNWWVRVGKACEGDGISVCVFFQDLSASLFKRSVVAKCRDDPERVLLVCDFFNDLVVLFFLESILGVGFGRLSRAGFAEWRNSRIAPPSLRFDIQKDLSDLVLR